jgi:DNA-binding beta-propeller fold protein YncE
VARWSGAGRARGLAWDAATHRLFVADAGQERLLVLEDDLSRQVAAVSLPQQPDQLILDVDTRRLYLTFPAVTQLVAIDADTLTVTAQTSLDGGPLLDLAWDAGRQRLYALTALAPGYRGLAVWDTPDLRLAALVAGEEEFPFRTAAALAISPTGQLLIPEATGLWQVWPDSFAVRNLYPLPELRSVGALTIDKNSGNLYGSQLPASVVRINR